MAEHEVAEAKEWNEPAPEDSFCWKPSTWPSFPVFIVRHHRVVMAVGFMLPLILGGIIVGFNLFEFSPQTGRDFRIRDDINSQRDDMEIRALESVSLTDEDTDKDEPERSERMNAWTIMLIYATHDTSQTVFTRERIAHMKKWEDKLKDDADRKKFCLTDGKTTDCSAQLSYLSSVPYFYPETINNVSMPTGKGSLVSNPDDVVKSLGSTQNLELFSEFFFARNFTQDSRKSQFTRAGFFYGAPLVKDGKKYKNKDDRPTEQRALYDPYATKLRNDVLDNAQYKDMHVYIYGGRLNQLEFQTLTDRDFSFAIGSIVFVLFYIGVHTRSAFLASFGMFQILMSFAYSYSIYRLVLGISFFQALHGLAIFIILGIGADNIFVLYDAWLQGGLYEELANDLEKRMHWAFHRAAKAMFVTSFTTMAAFLATGTSVIMPIATFGFFAAFLVIGNYWMVVTFYPAVVIEHHKNFREGRVSSYVFRCKEAKEEADVEAGEAGKPHAKTSGNETIQVHPENNDMVEVLDGKKILESESESDEESEASLSSEDDDEGAEEGETKPEAAETGGSESVEMKDLKRGRKSMKERRAARKARRAAKKAARAAAEAAHTETRNLDGLRPVEKFFYHQWSDFVKRFHVPLVVLFGLLLVAGVVIAAQLAPLTNQEEWFPRGYPFGEAQRALRDGFLQSDEDSAVKVRMVWGLKSIDRSGTDPYDPDDIGKLVFDSEFDASPRANQQAVLDTCTSAAGKEFVRKGLVTCFMEDYRLWALDTYKQFPVNFSDNAADQKKMFTQSLLAFTTNTTYRKYLLNRHLGFVKGELKFMRMEMTANLRPFQPYLDVLPERAKFEKFANERNAASPKGVNNAFQTSGFEWGWSETQQSFVTNAVQGMAISISVAFAVLIVSTSNWIVGGLATLTIVGIVSSTLAVMVLLGWQLGVTESISAVILIGFSVDYVVHLGNSYMESESALRFNKMRDAVTDMGVSVLAGAMTTFGSSLFLWGCTITFFTKFAVLIMSTISLSLAWSMCFFLSAMCWIGPENGMGDLRNGLRCMPKEKEANGKV